MLIFDCDAGADIDSLLNLFYETLQKQPVALSAAKSLIISVSCGFVQADNTNDNITELLRWADEALYRAKKNARGTSAEYTP